MNMKMLLNKIVLPILLALFVSSIFIVIHAYQTPLTTAKEIALYTYTTRGIFDYNVTLKPSTLYETNTLVNPSKVFLRLIDIIALNITYVFISQPQASNITSMLEVEFTLNHPQVWTREIYFTRIESQDDVITYTTELDMGNLLSLASNISKEVDIPTSKYIIEINCKGKTKFTLMNQTKTINYPFSLQISIDLSGKVIEFSTRDFTDTYVQKNTITEEQKIALGSVSITAESFRQISLAFLSTTSIATASYIGMSVYHRVRGPRESEILRKIRKYKSLIVKATDINDASPSTVVKVEDLDELVKISEELFKPIIYIKTNNKHLFYLFDEDAKYIYELEISNQDGNKNNQT